MRRMLINQNEPIRVFHQDVQFAEHANDLELLLRRVIREEAGIVKGSSPWLAKVAALAFAAACTQSAKLFTISGGVLAGSQTPVQA